MLDRFRQLLPEKEDNCLDKLFSNTINTVVTGKAYRDKCLHRSNYTYFKSWAKNEPRFATYTPKELSKLCHTVNEACWVYDNWDKIARNLNDERMYAIDVRRLSLTQLYLAKNIDWCLALNDKLRPKGKCDTPLYTKEKYDGIFQNIIDSGILDDIGHYPPAAASLGGRLQTSIIAYCRQRYQPY
jgi:hypothetical protein